MELTEHDATHDLAPLLARAVRINVDAILERCGGDHELVATLAGMFPAESEKLLKSMEEARVANDWLIMRRSAHTLKGLCSTFEANAAADAAQILEQAAGSGEPGTEEQVALLKTELAYAVDAVTQLQKLQPQRLM